MKRTSRGDGQPLDPHLHTANTYALNTDPKEMMLRVRANRSWCAGPMPAITVAKNFAKGKPKRKRGLRVEREEISIQSASLMVSILHQTFGERIVNFLDPDQSPEPVSRNPSAKGGPQSTKGPTIAPKSHKKGGRPPARKGRLGRNQYTKDRNTKQGPSVLSPNSNNSHEAEALYSNGVHGNGIAESNGLGKPSRPRHMNPNRTTLNDMKRRVAGILEFISHTQVEMAGLDTAKSRTSGPKSSHELAAPSVKVDDASRTAKEINGVLEALGDAEIVDEEAFGKLNAVEMMDVLTRRLMHWQGQFGKFGEK